MSDERAGGGGEANIIAWFHRDAGAAHATLAERGRVLGDLVEALGLDTCEPARRELQRLTRITCELAAIQFADL